MFSLSFPSSSLTAAATVKEASTGVEFPAVIRESRKLLAVGVRRKSVLGVKSIDIYAFGVYADDSDTKKLLKGKYGKLPVLEDKALAEDFIESDVCMTVRLQIIFGKLSTKLMRNAFEETVGSRLKKFGAKDSKELLQRLGSLFKDENKISQGSIIDLSRDKGDVLRTYIDGKEVGITESRVLCRSILDLYIGSDPFDKNARDGFEQNARALLHCD